jgi:hypothetical protein
LYTENIPAPLRNFSSSSVKNLVILPDVLPPYALRNFSNRILISSSKGNENEYQAS